MARGTILKILGAALAAVAVASVAASACGTAKVTAAKATPITFGDDFAFEDFTTQVPASASPSPTASAAAKSTGSSSTSSRPRSGSTQAASGPSGPVHCPSGVVTGEYENFSASESPDSEDDQPSWTVRVQGAVFNKTARPVRNVHVEVTVHADSAEAQSDGTTISEWVGVGSSHGWTIVMDEYESSEEPGKNDVTFAVTGWSWGDEFAKCPTQGFSG